MAIELPDGTVVRNIPEQVAYLTEENETLKQQLQMALSGVMKYKGSVATYADLPATGQEVGDVWNVIDTGANYCWSGTEWDEIGAAIDLSNVMDLTTAQTATAQKTFSAGIKATRLSRINPSGSVIVGSDSDMSIDVNDENIQLKAGAISVIKVDDDGQVSISAGPGIDINTNEFNLEDNGYNIISGHSGSILLYGNTLKNDGSESYGLVLPDTAAYIADKHIAAAEDVVDLASAQTISGEKTITSQLHFLNTTANVDYKIKAEAYGGLVVADIMRLVDANKSIHPQTDDTSNLGLSGYRWKNVYAIQYNVKFGSYEYQIKDGNFGQLYIGRSSGTAGIILDGNTLRTGQAAPQSNNTYDLGSSGLKWKDIYLSGVLSDGTNTANIADIKALIDYAKAQGWIS